MFRTAVIALLSILCLVLGATVFTSWHSQRQMAEQLSALAEQLKLLAEQQRAPASTPAVASAPEIVGQALCVQSELRFQPFFHGEPHFHEVAAYLTGLGFELVFLRPELGCTHRRPLHQVGHPHPVRSERVTGVAIA